MQRKFAGYILLSFLSFGIFTTVFHTVVNAQTPEQLIVALTPPVSTPTPFAIQTPTPIEKQTQPPSPQPTVLYTLRSIEDPMPTVAPGPITAEPARQQPAATATPIPTAIPTAVPTEIPSPTATPIPQPVLSAGEMEPLFEKYASEYHIDKEDLKRIAKCESGFNSNADTGLYAGMFQFHAQTWIANRTAMGLDSNPDLRKNAEESIRTAAYKISNGGRNAWPNC